jgi:predicted Zn-dependent peptidase
MLVNEKSNEKSYNEQMEAITSSHLRKTAANYFSGKKYVMIAIVPKKADDAVTDKER